jgi:predicted dehydrogenase
MNFQQASEMFDAARRHGRVLVEAFMYRSHPLTHAVIDAVKRGAIGDLQLIRTSFCYRTTRSDNIRFNRALGGGALMDVGCYCINFSRLFAGTEPTHMHATAHLGPTGVDLVTAGTLHFSNNLVASFTCGMDLHANNTAMLCGTSGYLEIPFPWKPPAQRAEYTLAYSTPPRMDSTGAPPPPRETRYVDANMELYALEARDFAAAVLESKPPALSEADTLGNMKILDELRRQIGLEFTPLPAGERPARGKTGATPTVTS